MKSLITTILILSASVSAFADHTQFERKSAAAPAAQTAKSKSERTSYSCPRCDSASKSAPKADASVKPDARRVHSRAYDRA